MENVFARMFFLPYRLTEFPVNSSGIPAEPDNFLHYKCSVCDYLFNTNKL